MADDVVGWVSGPTERGTLTLVWSCVITIFACTWTVLHLNVPGRDDTSLTIALRKFKWMAINILFPEFLFSKAVCDLRLALQELRGFDDSKTIEWTTHHKLRDGNRHVIKWSWEIEYPDGWSGLLYDLLRLDPPPRPPKPHADPESNDHELEARLWSFETPDDDHSTSSQNMPSQEQVIAFKTTTQTFPQKWTVVHSYYAQMGGLIYPDLRYGPCTITATHLTRLFRSEQQDTVHPTFRLVLGRDDIQDKSKADWLLKGLAVLQVTWIIINVIVRHITGLPISQIEIATIAFAVMAVMTYLANWWKPKDVSQPSMLQFHGSSDPLYGFLDRSQSFTQRIRWPTKAMAEAEDYRGLLLVRRVANDIVWMQGDIPLLFYLMAGSSLIFGGLHCLAWNFEFPTLLELICWRVASLTSAILPIVAFAISAIIGHLAAVYLSRHHFIPKLWAELKQIGGGWGLDSLSVLFKNWDYEAQYAQLEIVKDASTEPLVHEFINVLVALFDLFEMELGEMRNSKRIPRWKDIAQQARRGKELLEDQHLLEFWCRHEDFPGSKHPDLRRPVAGDSSITTALQYMLEVAEKVSGQAITFQKRAERASNFVFITSSILYTTARIIILALLFSSLRAAPAGIYQDTAWTRFLPKIS